LELVVKRYYFRKSADVIQSSAGGNHVHAKGCDGTQTVGSGWSGIRSGGHGAQRSGSGAETARRNYVRKNSHTEGNVEIKREEK